MSRPKWEENMDQWVLLTNHKQLTDDYAMMKFHIKDQEREISRLTAELEKAHEALEMYADPESYHAIAFLFDRPCGSFEDDFSSDHGHEDYDRPMPGKLAREALKETQ